jgi:pimeloyl-ACP methyl ester carboxylesterase
MEQRTGYGPRLRGEFVEVDGARLYYYAAGTRSKADPLLFLHGFPASSHLWRGVVPHIPAGNRIVVADLLGYGRSDRPGEHDVSIAGHAARVVGLMDALKIERCAVVGHDLGGGIAQHLAVEHGARVSRIALIASVGFDDWPPGALKTARAGLAFAKRLPAKPVMSMLRRALKGAYEEQELGAHSVEMYLRTFESPGGKEALMAHVGALDSAETEALVPRLKKLKIPTAIIWGEDDPFLPLSIGMRLEQTIPKATLHILPGVMHYPPETAPESVAKLLEAWLKRS